MQNMFSNDCKRRKKIKLKDLTSHVKGPHCSEAVFRDYEAAAAEAKTKTSRVDISIQQS